MLSTAKTEEITGHLKSEGKGESVSILLIDGLLRESILKLWIRNFNS